MVRSLKNEQYGQFWVFTGGVPELTNVWHDPESRDHEMNLSKGKDPAPEQINIDELQKILQNIDPNGDMNQVQGSGSIFNQSEFVFDAHSDWSHDSY